MIRKSLLFVGLTMLACTSNEDSSFALMTTDDALRFTNLAMECIPQEYPNKLGQLLRNESDLQAPRSLHPSFYGCYDWHSAVHGHWLLVKTLKTFPELDDRELIASVLSNSLSAENIGVEASYLERESKSWERMYGWAWFLQLGREVNDWDDPLAEQLAGNLAPLASGIRERYFEFLPVQVYPVRTGVHPNTAFGLSFAHDYALATGDAEFKSLIESSARRYYENDRNCPLDWEPSGEDFLSPCLEEAALMSRVMDTDKYEAWLSAFFPKFGNLLALEPVDASDRTDPKIAHLDGLNLSRAWNLSIIADSIDDNDIANELRRVSEDHLAAALPHVNGDHYVGSHWLGTFAMYAMSQMNDAN